MLLGNKVIFYHLYFRFSIYNYRLFFKRLIQNKLAENKIDKILRTNEECKSVTYGCLRFIDIYMFLSSSLDSLVKTVKNDNFQILKTEFPDKWESLSRNLA